MHASDVHASTKHVQATLSIGGWPHTFTNPHSPL